MAHRICPISRIYLLILAFFGAIGRPTMLRTFLRAVLVFFAVTGAIVVFQTLFGLSPGFGTVDYWSMHGILFLIAISLFPRLTLLFSNVASGGLFWWLGWFFAPRLLVAFLATISYWRTNPILVIISWLIALGGESSEKYTVLRSSRFGSPTRKPKEKWVKATVNE